MENKRDKRELDQQEQEQVTGGIGFKSGYYCDDRKCAKFAVLVSPTIDNKCRACGGALVYGHPPKTIEDVSEVF